MGFANADGALSTTGSDIKDYAVMSEDSSRLFSYLWHVSGGTAATIDVVGLASEEHTIEWIEPTTGDILRTDTVSGTSLSMTLPSFSDSIGLFIHAGGGTDSDPLNETNPPRPCPGLTEDVDGDCSVSVMDIILVARAFGVSI
ncbi:MAG: hypothetical protein ABIC95_00535 [archaeon]